MSFLMRLVMRLLTLFKAAETRSKHTARGVARRSWFYSGRHYVSGAGGVGDIMPASQLVWQLNRDRIREARFA